MLRPRMCGNAVSVLVVWLVGSVLAAVGCGGGSESDYLHQDPELMETMPSRPVIHLDKYSTDELLVLFARSDREFEKSILGGYDVRITSDALYELSKRIEKTGLESLSCEQRERLIATVREWLWKKGDDGNQSLIEFAARYDSDFTAEKLLSYPYLIDWYAEDAFLAFAKAGRVDEAWRLLKPRLNSADEFEVCAALEVIQTNKLTFAAEEVRKRTHAARWLIRLAALRALDALGDPGTPEALRTHLADIRRHSIGLRALSPVSAFRATALSGAFRGELIEALVRHNVTGAADTLEEILLNAQEPEFSVRARAGNGLLQLDRPRGIKAVRKLLQGGPWRDQFVGASVAEMGHAREVVADLQEVAANASHDDARHAATQALRMIAMFQDEDREN